MGKNGRGHQRAPEQRRDIPARPSADKAAEEAAEKPAEQPADKPTGQPAEKPAAPQPAGNPLGRIREILQKDQGRQLEERFSRVDTRLRNETATLRRDLEQRFDELESFVRAELTEMAQAQQSERAERDRSVEALTNEVRNLRIRTQENEQSFRNLLLEQSKTLSQDIRRAHEDQSEAHDEALLDLRAGKTDRDLLANLFAEVAVRLSENDLHATRIEDEH